MLDRLSMIWAPFFILLGWVVGIVLAPPIFLAAAIKRWFDRGSLAA